MGWWQERKIKKRYGHMKLYVRDYPDKLKHLLSLQELRPVVMTFLEGKLPNSKLRKKLNYVHIKLRGYEYQFRYIKAMDDELRKKVLARFGDAQIDKKFGSYISFINDTEEDLKQMRQSLNSMIDQSHFLRYKGLDELSKTFNESLQRVIKRKNEIK